MGTIAEKLQKLIETKEAIKSAIKSKGQTLEDSEPLSAYPNKILAIETGAQLPSLSNPASAAQILEGYEAIDSTGAKITGSIPDVAQATPSITVSDKGLITASTTQSAGYIAAGKKSATKQLTAQAAQTITPGTTDQTIASGQYLTGAQTIKGDSNLVAENIKSGVSIFGVAGSVAATGECTIVVVNESAEDIKVNIWKPGNSSPGLYGVDAGQVNSFQCITPMLVTVCAGSYTRVIDGDKDRSEFQKKNILSGVALSYTIPADATVGQIVIVDF